MIDKYGNAVEQKGIIGRRKRGKNNLRGQVPSCHQ